jgi:hypothetical protein
LQWPKLSVKKSADQKEHKEYKENRLPQSQFGYQRPWLGDLEALQSDCVALSINILNENAAE